MKRRSFLATAAAGLFGGFAPGRGALPASASPSDKVSWNEREQCWDVSFYNEWRLGRRYKKAGGGWGLETRCCDRSPWHRCDRRAQCDYCTAEFNEAIRLIESGEVTKHGKT